MHSTNRIQNVVSFKDNFYFGFSMYMQRATRSVVKFFEHRYLVTASNSIFSIFNNTLRETAIKILPFKKNTKDSNYYLF